jgi:hypothetical protein
MSDLPVKKPRGGVRFKPGNNANPLGGNAHNPVKRQLKKITTETLAQVFNEMLAVEPSKIHEVVNNEPTVLKNYIASCIQKGMAKGDIGPLMTLLERMVGKVKENVQIESKSISVQMTPEQVEEAMRRVNDKF